MPRPMTGQVIERPTRSGPTSFAIRYRVPGVGRVYETLGYSPAWNGKRAAEALADRLSEVRTGRWRSREQIEAERRAAHVPRVGAFLDEWLQGRRLDGLQPATIVDLEWRLGHLRGHFVRKLGNPPVNAIHVEDVDAYRRAQLRAGMLGATSINATLTTLAQVLDVALERGLVERNVAKGRRRRLPATTPARLFLEPEQLVALLDAARELDDEDATGRRYRRALLATLGYAGLRVGEALALRWRDLDLAGCKLAVRQAKTAAGVREVDVQPELLDELTEYRAVTRHAAPRDLVFPTSSGRANNRHAVRKRVVLRAAERANERIADGGECDPLPEGLSPHALRRTFASWLIAEGEDAAYVMQQLGHTDPTMTLALYARALRSKARRPHARRQPAPVPELPASSDAVDAVAGDACAVVGTRP
jgi:integrase